MNTSSHWGHGTRPVEPSRMRLRLRNLAEAPRDGRQIEALMDEDGVQVFREIYYDDVLDRWCLFSIKQTINESDYVIGWRHCAK